MIRTGIISTAMFAALQDMPLVFEGNWQDMSRAGKLYKKITAFQHYFTDAVVAQLETVFDSDQEFAAWIASDMAYLNRSWKQDYTDFKHARERLKEMVQELGGFNDLTPDEKYIAASWFVVSSEQIDTVLTFEERVKAGKEFDTNSAASRKARFDFAKSYLYNALEKADGDNVVGMILQNGFKELYMEYGQEGTMKVNYKGETDRPGIFDFVLGTPEGVTAFNYRMVDLITVPKYGLTPQQVVDRCIDILDNGNY